MLRVTCLICTAFVLFAMTPGSSWAQRLDPTAHLEAMKKLDFLVGHWEGEGWSEYRPGQRHPFQSIEIVESKLGGELLLIEGLHKNGEATVHHAFAMLSYDTRAGQYRFRSYLSGRGGGNFEAKAPEEGVMQWGMETPGGQIRYTITLNDAGQWFEVGEMSQDGETWRQIFEMTLDRVASDPTKSSD